MPTDDAAAGTSPAVVVIGRNEGERLRRCLESVLPRSARVVYVDSGSTDGSPEAARALGADVVDLDMSLAFTAARARNEGLRRVRARWPGAAFVQFVDGDCEVVPAWIATAMAFLESHPRVAAVCGRLRERFPERSVYNRLCDAEWDTPVGEAKACGGIAMMRIAALDEVGGYRDDLIAGEEPEMCVRLRARQWQIWRIDAEMAWHDAAMLHLAQWWRRTMRGGYAFAMGTALHGQPPERLWVRESRSAWIWGVVIPLVIVAAMLLVGPLALCGLLIYPLQMLRLFVRLPGSSSRARAERAVFLVLGKFAEALGQIKFALDQRSGARARIIEYK